MAIKGFKRNFRTLEILTDDQLNAVHAGTLRVMAETGITVDDDDALLLLKDNGCQVDFSNKRVRFPDWLIADCLAKCPNEFQVRARDPQNDLIISGGGDYTAFAHSGGMNTLDLDTLEPREATRKEFYDFVKILSFLPNVHMHKSFPYFGFAKVPQCLKLIESNAAKIRTSTKVMMEGSVAGNDRWNIEMAKATNQDLFNLVNPASPLTFSQDAVAAVYRYAKEGMPFHFASGSVAGSTAPATLAGALMTNNAESLAGIVLAQLIQPGARVWVGNFVTVQNMRTGAPAFGAIENSLHEVAYNQIWRKYKIPNWRSAAACSSSKVIDFQAAYETSMSALNCALSGASVVYFQGGINAQLTAHPIKAILDDEIAGMIGRFLRGIEVSEETLPVDLVNEIGPVPGHFLGSAHTRTWWKKEQFMPKLPDRLPYADWLKLGKKEIVDYARERMEEILSTYTVQMLPPEQEQAIEDILKDARNHYRKSGMISDDEWRIYQEDLSSPDYPFS